jgi:hypothetical protein
MVWSKWNRETIIEEAKKYTRKVDFIKGSPVLTMRAYVDIKA